MKHTFQAFLFAALAPFACSSAFAADVSVPSQYDWTGISVGVVGSFNAGNNEWDVDGTYTLENAAFGGGFIGYDHQIDQFVLGARATGQFGSMQEEDYPSFEYQSFFDFNARAGFAMDRTLIYATGGYSISNIEEDGETFSHGGYNVGGGLEYAVTGNVIVGAEYVYRSLEADCVHDMQFQQKINSVQAHVSLKF